MSVDQVPEGVSLNTFKLSKAKAKREQMEIQELQRKLYVVVDC